MPSLAIMPAESTEVLIPVGGGAFIAADVAIPPNAAGAVVFAHGSGSSRHSSRNRLVAGELNQRKIATVFADLLTAGEEQMDVRTSSFRFNIPLLTQRVVDVIRWTRANDALRALPLGLFGASTGAAAALDAAALEPDAVQAVVSRGGRPDLAAQPWNVTAATLLIVGGNDRMVIELNEDAMRYLRGVKKLEIIPGATHLFEEPGKLERVAELAAAWFETYLRIS